MNGCIAWIIILVVCVLFLYVCAIAARIMPLITGVLILSAIFGNPHKKL